MTFKRLGGIAATATLAIALLAIGAPAHATGSIPVTSLSVSPLTWRSGETAAFSVNGSSTDAGDYSYVGCYVYWINGEATRNQINGPFTPLVGDLTLDTNLGATDKTFRFATWANATCGNVDLSSTPDIDTGIVTITPQVVVADVTLTEGESMTDSVDYTDAAANVASPFDWEFGGLFDSAADADCGAAPGDTVGLPDGVSINDVWSANGSPAELHLSGSPAAGSAGDYYACVYLTDDVTTSANVWLHITVEAAAAAATTSPAELATTGTSAVTGTLAAVLALLIAGTSALLIRRRTQS